MCGVLWYGQQNQILLRGYAAAPDILGGYTAPDWRFGCESVRAGVSETGGLLKYLSANLSHVATGDVAELPHGLRSRSFHFVHMFHH